MCNSPTFRINCQTLKCVYSNSMDIFKSVNKCGRMVTQKGCALAPCVRPFPHWRLPLKNGTNKTASVLYRKCYFHLSFYFIDY